MSDPEKIDISNKFIFTGLQITSRKYLVSQNSKIFSMNKIWNDLIASKELYGIESNLNLNKRTKKYELLCKLYEPLPQSYTTTDTFRVAENIVDRVILNVDMGTSPVEDDRIPLRGPNFKIDVRLNNSVPSAFKTYGGLRELRKVLAS